MFDPTRAITVHGKPITEDLQMLFGAYGPGPVTGILQTPKGLLVTYTGGVHWTFVPIATGGSVPSGLSAPAIIASCSHDQPKDGRQ